VITIDSIRIKNFGPLNDFEFKFPRTAGTFVIKAPNGAGKSHFVGAIEATSTNQVMPDKPRGSLVRNYGINGETARIEATYDVDGELLTVTRSISVKGGNSDIVAILADGGYPDVTTRHAALYKGHKYAKAGEIEELVASTFGINNAVQTQAVFVKQGQAGAIWRGTQATRAAAFQFLSGADRLVETHRYVDKRLAQFKVVDYSEDLALADADAARLERELADVEARLAGTGAVDLEGLARLHREVERVREVRKQIEQAARLEADIAHATEQGRAAVARVQEIQAERQNLGLTDEDAVKLRDSLEEARAVVRAAEQIEETGRKIFALNEQISSLHNKLGEIALDDVPAVENYVRELNESVARVDTQLSGVINQLKKFGTSGKCPTCGLTGVCPSCGHIEKDLSAASAEWQTTKVELEARVADLGTQAASAKARLAAAHEAERRHQSLRREIDSLEAAKLAHETNMGGPSPERTAAARSLLESAAGQLVRHDELRRREHAARQEVDHFRTTVGALLGRKIQPESLDVSPEREAELEREIKRLTGLSAARGELEGNRKGLQSQLASARVRAASLRDKVDQQAKTARTAELLGGIKAATHPNAIPKDRAAAYIMRVNRSLGVYCRELRLPFTLFVDPEQQDLMFRNDELCAPAAHRLSGGQKSVAAVAWHMALFAIHGGRTGFMVMDEPFDGMDEDNRRCCSGMLSAMSAYCRNVGMQILVVSHNPDVDSGFDSVIDLEQQIKKGD
jgi:DNA repair exonuclease SbcCD ATPase subunit